jgi:predicted amidohydrolase
MYFCAVQMHWDIEDYKSPQAFESKIESLMKKIRSEAGEKEDILVAFPEDVGTPLVFMRSYEAVKDVKTLQDAVKNLIKKHGLKVLPYKLRYKVSWIRALALATAKRTAKTYLDVFSRMAKKYRVTLVAGSVLLPDFEWNKDIKKTVYKIPDGNIYNVSFLFNEQGELIGTQKKTHLVPGLEDREGFDLCVGKIEDLKVYPTPFGNIGIAVCLDCFKEPAVQALAEKKADILIQPSANPQAWDKEEQTGWMEGCKKAMDTYKSISYALNPMMVGCLFDLCFEGQSSVMTNKAKNPQKMSYMDLEETDGFVKVAKGARREEILLVRKDSI